MTFEEYGRLIALGPPSVRFADELPERALLLRHDIDDRPQWIEPMARVEAQRGAVSTYCLQVRSRFYGLDDEADRAVRVLLDCGHELGLHFDSSAMASDDAVLEGVIREVALLEARYETPVRVVSFHMPGVRPVGHIELPAPLINTYAPRFFTEIAYLSDSNQNWRGKDPETELRDARRIQFLTHPTLWSGRSLRAILEEQAARLGTTVDELATDDQKAVM
ncbi:MAG: hypothetical protein R2736_19305 [Solirubrobacterales bacterium]